jgi:hypothetical protein
VTTDSPPCDADGVVDPDAPDPGPFRKPFAAFIQSHEYGQTHDELTRGLHDLLQAVQTVGKGGSLAVKVTAKPVGRGDERQVTVSIATKVTLPEMGSLEAIYWIDDDGNLTRNDPRQQTLPLQVVERPAATEARQVVR